MSRKWVFELLEKSKARRKLFIVDACRDEHSFGGGKALGSARTLTNPIDSDSHDFVMLASCSPRQQSWEDRGLKHGVFTFYLAEGLSGAAKDEDGYVTIMGLFHYTSSKTKKFVLNNKNEVQVPMLRLGDGMTDFCIAKLDSVNPIPPPSFTPSYSSQEPRPGVRRVEIICGEEFVFHWCPAGTCMTKPIIGRQSNYSPIYGEEYEIKIPQGFWMLEHLVTQKQWKAVMGSNPSLYNDDDNSPVTNVTWNDCLEFCRKTGLLLPTDDQLEYAMNAGASSTGRIGVGVVSGYEMLHTPNKWGLYKDDFGAILTAPTASPNGSDRVDHGGSVIRYVRISKKQERRIER